ncbi:MAG: cobyrinate a,c-diamide synthase [Marinobacterium sp.]|nr:cobyrinate a,c-diamide synthase [Marinobacterium sp.]
MSKVYCPALLLAAPASGTGKTTITAALARYFRNKGKIVRVFKTGPDYLDPQILAQASGQPVEQLDLWMAGEHYCQQKLYEAACEADLILVEGVMGMFDGDPSSADLAARFGLPLAIVMNVKGMAQTTAAIATGLADFRADVHTIGLIANNCSTVRHAELIRDPLPARLPLLACLRTDETVSLPERHLGLVQAEEVQAELEQRFELGAQWIADGAEPEGLTELPPAVAFEPAPLPAVKPQLQGQTIAIARDRAFSFIYDANLRLLQELGARLRFFSPLNDAGLPEADALWLPGGYPELHAQALAQNQAMQAAIRDFHGSGKPILAECGGLLYSLQRLTDLEGNGYPMLGLLQGEGAMRGKRGCQGMQTALLPEGEVQGHAHHRSRSEGTPEPISHGRRQRHSAPGEAIYRDKGLTASYLHLFFPSNPDAIAQLFLGSVSCD